MTEITRTTAPDAGDWFDNLPEADAAPAESQHDRTVRQNVALNLSADAMHQVTVNLKRLGDDLANGLQGFTDRLDHQAVADTVAWVQDQRRALAALEAYAVRELGRMEGTPDTIVLTDGRHAEVMRGKTRKAWDHEAWQTDVRNHALRAAGLNMVVDTETGEEVDLFDVMTRIQAVHGSAAPKVRALKALGLDADDYAESAPGPWGMKVSATD